MWTPRFSAYLTDFLKEGDNGTADATVQLLPEELSVGDVVQAALDDGLAVEGVVFEQGGYVDIGTPDDLDEARRIVTR